MGAEKALIACQKNGITRNPAGPGLNEHVINPESLNVAENGG